MKIPFYFFLMGLIMSPYPVISQKDSFNPIEMKSAYFDKPDIKDGNEFPDKQGNWYKIIKTEYKRGLMIKIVEKGKTKWVEHGMHFILLKNGTVKDEIPYQYGKREGVKRHYLDDGSLSEEKTFKNHVAHGICYVYHDNGSLHRKGNFENGEEEGKWEIYYKGDGKKTGKIHFEIHYHEGKRHGTHKYFNREGKLKETKIYDMGSLVSKSP